MGRIERLMAQTDGLAEVVGPVGAWRAAEIVTERWGRYAAASGPSAARQVATWFRLAFVTRAVINRERTR